MSGNPADFTSAKRHAAEARAIAIRHGLSTSDLDLSPESDQTLAEVLRELSLDESLA
jgi:hypothetical protein